ncbi:MAG: putative lipid II flippase FtsW [Gammaproteobacteria bacterium]
MSAVAGAPRANWDLELGVWKLDALLALVIAVLIGIGMVLVTSASMSLADRELGQPWYFAIRHATAVGVGLGGGLIALLIPTQVWFRLSGMLLLVSFVLLVMVLIPNVGHSVNGATRWLKVGLFNVQVSELARVCLIIYIASYSVRHREAMTQHFWGLAKPMLAVTLMTGLLLLQPDFGAAVVVVCTALALLFVGGARIREFLVLTVLAGAGLSLLAVSAPYRLKRLTGFLDPWADPYDSGFQLVQSLIAIGRGDWFGVGLGGSVQKLFYLPEAHTDFVFAVLTEELGLLGALCVVGAFLVLVWRALRTAKRANAAQLPFQANLATGIGIWLGLQAFINIGVNAGLLPTKGLTLPLLSYGRTSVIVTLACLGLLLRIHHELVAAEGSGRGRARGRGRG